MGTPHHFPCAVGGRVYFPLSGVYVNEKKKRTGLLADRWLHRIGSLRGFEMYLMGTTLSSAISFSRSALNDFLISFGEVRALLCVKAHGINLLNALCGKKPHILPPQVVLRHDSEPRIHMDITDAAVWLIRLINIFCQPLRHARMWQTAGKSYYLLIWFRTHSVQQSSVLSLFICLKRVTQADDDPLTVIYDMRALFNQYK